MSVLVVLFALVVCWPAAGCSGPDDDRGLPDQGTDVDPDFTGLEGQEGGRRLPAAGHAAVPQRERRPRSGPANHICSSRRRCRRSRPSTSGRWPSGPTRTPGRSISEVGKAMKADMVVGVDLEEFSIYQGQTLYQGKANATVRVYDCTQGRQRWCSRRSCRRRVYPPNSGVPTSDRPEAEFRREFVAGAGRPDRPAFLRPRSPRRLGPRRRGGAVTTRRAPSCAAFSPGVHAQENRRAGRGGYWVPQVQCRIVPFSRRTCPPCWKWGFAGETRRTSARLNDLWRH